jgi:hypothetical protein
MLVIELRFRAAGSSVRKSRASEKIHFEEPFLLLPNFPLSLFGYPICVNWLQLDRSTSCVTVPLAEEVWHRRRESDPRSLCEVCAVMTSSPSGLCGLLSPCGYKHHSQTHLKLSAEDGC